jgi:tryptophanyl-tRNA synthetase
MGLKVAMITGDAQSVADSVARRIGIDEVAAQVLPADKADVVRRFPDGVQAMSKSVGNVIEPLADDEVIRKQVMSMVTDTQRILRTDPGRPEVCNVCQLHRFFGDDYETIWDGERTARTGCVDTKKLLTDRIISHFAEARERARELESRPDYVEDILRAGAARLAPLAAETMREVHERMGLARR